MATKPKAKRSGASNKNRPARFIAEQNRKGQWYMRVRARGNGKSVGPTEGYTGHPARAFADMLRAIDEAKGLPIIVRPFKGKPYEVTLK